MNLRRDHPLRHSTPVTGPNQAIARDGLALLTRVGSTVHGCGVDDQDDEDQLGVCVEPPHTVIGLDRFEQFEWRTRPTGVRSGPGDVDLTVYSLRKYVRLAAQGNPSILVPLFVPTTDVLYASWVGIELRRRAELVVSRRAGYRFLGYLRAQRARLLGERSARVSRPELVERYGFDTKFAYHAARLGLQGVELLRTGRLTLPMAGADRAYLRAVRTGGYGLDEVVTRIDDLETCLLDALTTSDLPESPDRVAVNEFLHEAHRAYWCD